MFKGDPQLGPCYVKRLDPLRQQMSWFQSHHRWNFNEFFYEILKNFSIKCWWIFLWNFHEFFYKIFIQFFLWNLLTGTLAIALGGRGGRDAGLLFQSKALVLSTQELRCRGCEIDVTLQRSLGVSVILMLNKSHIKSFRLKKQRPSLR